MVQVFASLQVLLALSSSDHEAPDGFLKYLLGPKFCNIEIYKLNKIIQTINTACKIMLSNKHEIAWPTVAAVSLLSADEAGIPQIRYW